jgi:hypothetical protein
VLLTDTARVPQLEPGLRDAVLSFYASYPRTVSHDGTSASWPPTRYPKLTCPNIDTLFSAATALTPGVAQPAFGQIGDPYAPARTTAFIARRPRSSRPPRRRSGSGGSTSETYVARLARPERGRRGRMTNNLGGVGPTHDD